MTEANIKSIVKAFCCQAKTFPDRIAVKYNFSGFWQQIPYSQLLLQAQSTAALLKARGLQPAEPVILASRRDAQLCSNLLGILWAGGHYVFIDPHYPSERQQLICRDTRARFGLCMNPAQPPISGLNITWHSPAEATPEMPAPTMPDDPELPAYIVFTSGSTGTPKGVVTPHRGVTRLVLDTDYISFSEQEVFLQLSALSFDASTLELWGPLLNGGCCVLHPETSTITPHGIQESIKSQGITSLWLTASLYNTLITERPECLNGIRQLLIGGEALSVSHIQQGLQRLPETRFFNGYGPTENTTFTTVYPIPKTLPPDMKRIPIGFPIQGTSCDIFDAQLKPLTNPDSPGELIVFGEGLALGYLNRPELTAERFVEVTCRDGQVKRGYRTGDLVLRLANGSYDYLQRNDKQVKIDGHRIEPGEIEHFLNELEEITAARVLLRTGPLGQKRLTAYVASKGGINRNALRARLGKSFPHYMVPHFILPIPELPINQNGKLDESRLPDPFQSLVQPADHKLVSSCWESILGRRLAGHEHFLDAGGTSLEAIRLTELLEKKLQLPLPPTFVFEHPSINAQANYFQRKLKTSTTSATIITPAATPQTRIGFAVIGMACRFPGACNLDEYWQNLLEGKESISFFSDDQLSEEVPRSDRNSPFYVPAKGIVEDCDKFDAAFFGISPLEADLMDPQQRVMLELCWHTLEDAGLIPGDSQQRTGVFIGSNWPRYYQQYVLPNKALLQRFGVLNSALANEADFLSTRISYKLNLKGPSVNLYTACSTGLVAIAQACAAIEQGQCEQALAGGVSITTPLHSGYLYQEGGMLSQDGHCRPFDAQATGTTFNDGAGLVVIKRQDLAERDGDRIYALIKGFAVNNDGETKASYTAPSVSGQVEVYNQALAKAGIDPTSVGFIETHGTATPLGDPIEVEALRRSYGACGSQQKRCALGSVKSNIGHTIHAAGIAGFIKTVLAVRHNQIPPNLFFKTPNPKLNLDQSPFFVNSEVQPWPIAGPRRAAVTSLGVGGTNAHVIIEQYQPQYEPQYEPIDYESTGCEEPVNAPVSDDTCYSLLLSAKSRESLQAQIESYRTFFHQKGPSIKLADAAYTSAAARGHFKYRAAVTGSRTKEVARRLADRSSLILGEVQAEKSPKTGFLFTGQGAQCPGMGRWLYEHEPDYRQLFDQGCEILREQEGWALQAMLFNEDPLTSKAIHQTRHAQPALFLLETGLARLLQAKGCEPDFLIGHSIGEFAAAVIAGIFSFEDALRIVARRGALMQSMPPGKMLVVRKSRSELDGYLDSYLDNEISLAAVNAPGLCVLAGPEESIRMLEHRLTSEHIKATLLHTSHAFHTPMMQPIVKAFRDFVAAIPSREPQLEIFSTATGKCLSSGEARSADYWALQLRNPVRFADALAESASQYTQSSLALVEVGPGTTLTNLVALQAMHPPPLAVSALPSSGHDQRAATEIQTCLNQLWVQGHPIDWKQSLSRARPRKISLPGYAFKRDRHWLTPLKPDADIPASALVNTLSAATTSAATAPSARQRHSQEHHLQEILMNPEQHHQSVQQELQILIKDITGYDLSNLEPDTHFAEAGLDSLLLTQVATAIDRKYAAGLSFRHLIEDYTCLSALSAFMAEKISVNTHESLGDQVTHARQHWDVAVATQRFLSTPPVPEGARLGKNADGKPAYFIEDPNNQGQYIEVEKL